MKEKKDAPLTKQARPFDFLKTALRSPLEPHRELHLSRSGQCRGQFAEARQGERAGARGTGIEANRVGHVVALPPELKLLLFRPWHRKYFVYATIDIEQPLAAERVSGSGFARKIFAEREYRLSRRREQVRTR